MIIPVLWGQVVEVAALALQLAGPDTAWSHLGFSDELVVLASVISLHVGDVPLGIIIVSGTVYRYSLVVWSSESIVPAGVWS